MPVSNALCETNTYKPHYAKKDEDGKVLTAPRNFTTKKPKTGKDDSTYFERPDYVSKDLPYVKATAKILRATSEEGHKPLHDVKFKPAKHFKEPLSKAPYEHMNDRVDVKKQIKDEDGHVITQPRNFYTCAAKSGKTHKKSCFDPFPAAITDDFNWPRKVAKKEMDEKKKLEQEKPFSQRAKTWGGFNTVK